MGKNFIVVDPIVSPHLKDKKSVFFQDCACTHFVLRQERVVQEHDALNPTQNTKVYPPNKGDMSMRLARHQSSPWDHMPSTKLLLPLLNTLLFC
jgi:hypothetical protein